MKYLHITLISTTLEVSSPSRLNAVQVKFPLWNLWIPWSTRFLPPAKILTPDSGSFSTRRPCKKERENSKLLYKYFSISNSQYALKADVKKSDSVPIFLRCFLQLLTHCILKNYLWKCLHCDSTPLCKLWDWLEFRNPYKCRCLQI